MHVENEQYAAGVMILGWNGHEICALLGLDQYNTFSDFGGKCDVSDKGIPYITASREFYEETLGIFEDLILTTYTLHNANCIVSKSFTKKPYYMYVIWMEYSVHYPLNFNTVYNYVATLPGVGYQFKEKKKLSWISLNSIMNMKQTIPLRNVFAITLQNNKDQITKIALELKARNNNYNYNGRRP